MSNNEAFQLPEGVEVPASIDPSLLQGDVADMLRDLPVDQINAAFATYEKQHKLREIRNPSGYLRGILRGGSGNIVSGGGGGRSSSVASKYGLPVGVIVPSSITESMLEDRNIREALKPMSARDIRECFRDFDEQVRKKRMIRNNNAYLLGIIKSGPYYALPQGVVLPSSLSLSMLKGELLETLQDLPCAHINVAFGEYDEQMTRKRDSIRNEYGYLLGIVKRMQRTFEEEATEHVQRKSMVSPSTPKRESNDSNNATQSPNGKQHSVTPATLQAVDSPGTLSMMTESYVNVTNELMMERKARNELEERMKTEQKKSEESKRKVHEFMAELRAEKEQRERSVLEVERLRKDLSFEKSLRETAEAKARMLEDSRERNNVDTTHGADTEQLRKLELELSIERGLREKTEKLLRTAESRIHELKRELQYMQQQQTHQPSPFSNWLGSPTSPVTGTSDHQLHRSSQHGDCVDNRAPPDLHPSLSGFDAAAFSLSKPM